jgi:broad specificity phosphatase PhoE
MLERTKETVKHWNKNNGTKTIFYVAHNDVLAMLRNAFLEKDYHIHRKSLVLQNAEF